MGSLAYLAASTTMFSQCRKRTYDCLNVLDIFTSP